MKPLLRLFSFFCFLALPPVLLASRTAAAANPPVAVEVVPGTPEIDASALRDAVSRELDAPVLEGAVAPGAAFAMIVSIDRERSELVVERRDAVGGMSRRVPLPADAREALRVAVFLIGNLARDEASELVNQLRPRVEEPASPPAPPPPPPPAEAPRTEAPVAAPRFWVGVDFAYDLAALPGATQACSGGGDYACVDSSGNDFTASGVAGLGNGTVPLSDTYGRIQSGLKPGNIRALVSFDYAATTNLLVGARVGYVFDTYPGSAAAAFPPLHLEARATYVIGDAPLAHAGIAPYVMVAAGVSQWSSEVGVTVAEPVVVGGASLSTPDSIHPVSANAWKIGGPGFASLGAGVRWAITPGAALLFGPRFNVAFGTGSALASIAPELGLQYGF